MIIGIDVSRALAQEKTGIEKYSQELLEEILAQPGLFKKHQVILFIKKGAGPARERLRKRLPANFQLREIGWPLLWTQIGLAQAARRERVEALLIPSHAAPLLFKGKLIYVLHGLEVIETPKLFSWRDRILNAFLIRASVQRATKIIAVSGTTRQKAIERLGVAPAKITVIYEGVKVKPVAKSAAAGADSAATKKRHFPFLLYLGRLEARKNVVNLIRAFGSLKQDEDIQAAWPDLKLILAGGKGYGYACIKRVKQRSAFKGDIMEPGYVSEREKERLLTGSLALVNLSYNEGFGRPVLEALSLGTPVILAKIPVFEELYAGLGSFVSPDDPALVVAEIKKLLQQRKAAVGRAGDLIDGEKLAALKEKSRWSRAAAEIAEVFDKI